MTIADAVQQVIANAGTGAVVSVPMIRDRVGGMLGYDAGVKNISQCLTRLLEDGQLAVDQPGRRGRGGATVYRVVGDRG